MKQVIEKYKALTDALENESRLDSVTKADLKKCLAIYINGQILLAFHSYAKKHKVLSADMIAFFYLHLQMSGAANEAFSKGFTSLHPELSKMLFDNTSNGKGAPRFPRFAGAHSLSLAVLLNDYKPALLQSYIAIVKEILPVIESCILKYVPTLSNELHMTVKINFAPMPCVDFSLPQFKVNAQQADASWLLESIKTIDLIASIFDMAVQTNFLNSVSGQALAILSRQIVANNMFLLRGNDPAFAELRQYRNCSAHAFVMWEIQNNPTQLWFNCKRLVLDVRGVLESELENLPSNVYGQYLNPPSLELKAEQPCELIPQAEKTKVKKKKKKPAGSVVLHTYQDSEESECLEFHTKQAKQSHMIKLFIDNFYSTGGVQGKLQTLLKNIIGILHSCHAIIPGSPIHDINEPLIGKAVRNLAIIGMPETIFNFDFPIEHPLKIRFPYDPKVYRNGLSELNLYFVSSLFFVIANRNVALLNEQENLELFKQALKTAFDYGASPNCLIQANNGLFSVLSYSIINNFPADVITFLLDQGANVDNIVGNRACISPLTHAARRGPEIVPLLLQAGANPLEITYDPNLYLLSKSSIFYDILASFDIPPESRKSSLKFLYTHAFQKYGEEALLACMNTPAKIYVPGKKTKISSIQEIFATIKSFPTREQLRQSRGAKEDEFALEDAMPVMVLHQKVETVLSNPRFNFYKLILNNEIEILVQEISMLKLPKEILAAMGITAGKEEAYDGKKWTAVEFAVDMGLLPLALYLSRVRAFCQAPSVMASADMTGYFTAIEECMYTTLSAAFSGNIGYEPTILTVIGDYWGMGAERQSVAYHCL